MPAPDEKHLVCEQCGASLQASDAHCLHCMLAGGFEAAEPNESRTAPEPETLTGTRFYQHYEIETRADGSLHKLGRGAMGITYKALDVNLHLPVALKVINARFSAQPDARARFLREARAAARLRHPNVASVFHYGTLERGAEEGGGEECFYAMEFVEGETLEARVRRDGPLPTPLALQITLQITQALAAAEKRGLIHRDLKPSNIMLAAEAASEGAGWVKVIDFGLAKAIASDEREPTGDTFATRGGFVGTPQFASPEQIDNGELDVRSDIYSLGVTLWFALTGDLPFAGGSLAETRDRQLHRPLPVENLKEAGVPAPVIALLSSMLAPDPAQRPASSNELRESIARCLETLQPRRRMRQWILAAAALVAALAIGYLLARRGETSAAEKSVAVLPLANLSEERENAFFAEGIQDDVLTSLAKIKELKVISRSSVLQYQAGTARDLSAIGRELGVSHVVEGSVRRAGDRVLVNVQLVDTRTHRQVWAERYDRTLYDALTLQGELATEIASALQATLDPEEKTRVQTKPTSLPEAYVLYLRARSFELRPTYLLEDFQTAETLYTQALALDPQFALAHARLSSTLAYIYRNSSPTEELKNRAHAEADEALRLQPQLGEGHLARALCFYRIERD
ncbi:MAG: protein kinase, partial [Verrucomicrobiota bacterium]|nr:protein kinase [Verrucomicrobiota bacterium]